MSPLGWLTALLIDSGTWADSNTDRSHVTGLGHALRVATLAEQAGADPEAVTVALLHDAAKPLSSAHHGEVIAEILRDRVHWCWCAALRFHGLFQADLIHGTTRTVEFADEPWFGHASTLAGWDAAGFDPDMGPYPLEHFLHTLAAVLT